MAFWKRKGMGHMGQVQEYKDNVFAYIEEGEVNGYLNTRMTLNGEGSDCNKCLKGAMVVAHTHRIENKGSPYDFCEGEIHNLALF